MKEVGRGVASTSMGLVAVGLSTSMGVVCPLCCCGESNDLLFGLVLSGVKVGKDLIGVLVGVGIGVEEGVEEGVSVGVGVGVASFWACAALLILFSICVSKSSNCSTERT